MHTLDHRRDGLDHPPAADPADLGTVRNWVPPEERALIPDLDPEPGAIVDGLRRHAPEAAGRLEEALGRFPAVGDEFAGFQLAAVLGRGTFGRVYLARQTDLSGRPVALKVSADVGGESRMLAQLQHTNIVPVYSVHRAGPFQAVCMPYFGSTTLAQVLRHYRKANSLPATGRQLIDTIRGIVDETELPTLLAPGPGSIPTPGRPAPGLDGEPAPRVRPTGDMQLLAAMDYVDAVCWIGARVADALAHAHERGIVHNDLKPANVLLADDGRPMLLDFGVSDDLTVRAAARTAPVGGTLPYMSPEHLESLHQQRPGTDARSDVYSLGILLYELLTGRFPFTVHGASLEKELPGMLKERRAGAPRLAPAHPKVTPALEAIVRKCLDPDPARRYQSAAHLRDDLDRHRTHLPLKHAPEPSVRERVRKWARRHPKLTSNATLAAAAGVLLALCAAGYYHRGQQLERYEAQAAYRDFGEDVRAAQYLLTARTPDRDMVSAGVQRCEAALGRYGVLDDAGWEGRPAYKALPEADRRQLRAQLADLCVLLARGYLLAAPVGPAGEERVRAAARLNELAERLTEGDVPGAVWAQRAELRGRLGDRDAAAKAAALATSAAPATARDHYLLGSEAQAAGRYKDAIAAFRRSAELDPENYWAYFGQAVAHEGLGQFAEARYCYTTAVALWPGFHWGYYNRGLASLRLRDYKAAKADLDRAAKLNPDFADTYLNLALAHQGLREYDAGIAALDRAQQLGAPATRVLFMRSRVRGLAGDKAGADRDLKEGMRLEPEDEQGWVARGLARLGSDLPGAVADFDAALKLNPRSLPALQNKSHALSKLGRHEDAAAALTAVVELYPDYAPARAGRGVMYGRLGRWKEAEADAAEALRKDPGPSNAYQVAGIYALLSKHDPKHKAEAVRLLSAALRAGFGYEYVETDKDLDPIRGTPEFKRVLDGTRSLRPAAR